MPETVAPVITARELVFLAPEIVLAIGGLLVLVADLALFRGAASAVRRVRLGQLTAGFSLLALVAGILVLLPELPITGGPNPMHVDTAQVDYALLGGTLAGDASTVWLNLVLATLLLLVALQSMAWDFTEHWGEYYALLLWSAVGMMLLVAADELLTLFLTLETMTICLYLLTALEKSRQRSAEAGLKYFVYGSVASALFLFGLSLVYGLTGSTRLVAIRQALGSVAETGGGFQGQAAAATAALLLLVGLGFKLAAVPFHQWAPDTYEGAPAPVAGWIASGSKLASVVALMKLFLLGLGLWATNPKQLYTPGWVGLLGVLAAVSMTYGNFAALSQRSFKRMLAYSSVAHAGYILVGVLAAAVSQSRGEAAGAVLFYLVVYSFATVGAFAVATWMATALGSEQIDDLNGLGRRRPGLAIAITVLMLSLIGLPPLAGFFGKLGMFMGTLNTAETGTRALTWLVALGLLNSVVSAFFYVRVLRAMFLRPAENELARLVPSGVVWSLVVAAAINVGLGLYPPALLDPMQAAAFPMLSGGISQRFNVGEQGTAEERAQKAAEREAQMRERLKREGVRAGAG